MSAQTYPVTFGYGAYDGVYYTASRPHRGNDRPTPTGTPILIGSTRIGLTGATGLVSGPHLHTQAGYDEWCQTTVEPSPYEFQAGTVVNVGWGSQWGNYVIIQTGDKYICYAHLSNINVHDGQVITGKDDGDMEAPYETALIYAQELLFRDMGRDEWEKYHKGKSRNQLFDDFRASDERKNRLSSLSKGEVDQETKDLARQLYEKLK